MYSGDGGYKIMYSTVFTAPAVEPIGIEDIGKTHIKVDADDEDSLLALFIQAAREYVEDITGRSLITQTREVTLDHFPCTETIRLSHGPVQSITSVKYQDTDDAEQTLSADSYWTDIKSNVARIVIKNSWPATKRRPNAVTIRFVSGYGASATTVPAALREAVLIVFAWMYENRDQPVPSGLVDQFIGPYIINQDVSY